jgi:GT2 family glycosyltransferase
MTAWQREENELIAGRIDLFFKNSKKRNVAELHEAMFAFQQERNVQHGYAVTANLIVGKKIFKSLGGFNPDTLSGGDVEFSKRAAQKGIKLRYVDNVVVRHPARDKIKELAQKRKRIISGLYSLRHVDVNIAREFRLLQLIKHLLPPVLTYRALRRRVASGEITGGELFKVMIVVYYQKLLSFFYKAALIYTN